MSIIHSPLKEHEKILLLLTGGLDQSYQTVVSDAWLLSIGDGASWTEVSVMKNSNAHIIHVAIVIH